MSTRVSDADRGCPMRANYSAGAAEGSGLNHLAGLSSYYWVHRLISDDLNHPRLESSLVYSSCHPLCPPTRSSWYHPS